MPHDQSTSTDPDLAKEAIYLRGLLINRFSAVEHGISEIIFRAYMHPAYRDFGKPPFLIAKRRERLLKILSVDGPLNAYQEAIEPILTEIGDLEAYRRFVAHAIMVPRGRAVISFRMFHVTDGNHVEGMIDTNVVEMTELSDQIGKLSREFLEIVTRVCREVPLPFV